MVVDVALWTVLMVIAIGLFFSVGIERALCPRPPIMRPKGAWEVHVGLCCAVYGLLVLLTGRPWCAVVATLAILVTLVLVNNAKQRSLREPFLCQDYDFFLDALRYPRFFLPFLGVKNFLLAAAFFLCAVAGFIQEPVPASRFEWNGQLGGVALVLGAAGLLLGRAWRKPLPVSFDPQSDVRRLGLLGSLWAYGRAVRALPVAISPFEYTQGIVRRPLPHLVAVQSESFFDARSLYTGIRPEILHTFDAMRAESVGYGALTVPAWGANTVRTEFAFLTGIESQCMGVHRFNPYRVVKRGWEVNSLPLFLKSLGYRTICIHPYWGSYYYRDKIFRRLGFDEFWDIRTFGKAQYSGAYVADAEVGERIAKALRQASAPVFIFAITMENHGPLHMERAQGIDRAALYDTPPPDGCAELTTYLHHLQNADKMLGRLRETLQLSSTSAALCWFGDHVPIMPATYEMMGAPTGEVPYLWWCNQQLRHDSGLEFSAYSSVASGSEQDGLPLQANSLALAWLRTVGLIPDILR